MRLPIVMLIAALVVSACGGVITNGEPTTTQSVLASVAAQPTTSTTTLVTTTTQLQESTSTTIAPILGGITVRHNDGCSYEGPTEFDVNSAVTFTFINATEGLDIGFAVRKVDEGTSTEDIFEGVFAVSDEEEDRYSPYLNSERTRGIEHPLTVTLNRVGLHALICFQLSDDPNEVFPEHASTLFTVNG